MNTAFRTEHDFLGERQIPAHAYWGVHTARAMENFPITGTPISAMPDLVRALATLYPDKESAQTEALLARYKQTSETQDLQLPDARIVEQADAWAKFCAGDGKAMGAIVGAGFCAPADRCGDEAATAVSCTPGGIVATDCCLTRLTWGRLGANGGGRSGTRAVRGGASNVFPGAAIRTSIGTESGRLDGTVTLRSRFVAVR